MTLNDLVAPAVVAAAVSGFVTILGNIFSIRSSRGINSEKIASEKDLAERKFRFEIDLAKGNSATNKLCTTIVAESNSVKSF